MDPEASVCHPLDLEHMLTDESTEPRYLRLSLLESITNNFASDMVIGSGGFAVVYKGLLQNGIVAVKKLTQTLDVHEKKFEREVANLMRVKHKNIVRCLGYCSDTQKKVCELNGKIIVMAEERQRFLCFEYLPCSLDKYIKDSSLGHEWRTSYQIIKGICEGLHHLHQQNIVHLDLKPANILLDHYMVPKIADFGLSKCFDENETRALTSNPLGTLGYMAPESFGGLITFKTDMYSLGIIIIEILTGNKWCPDIDNVVESWTLKLKLSSGDARLEPIRVCAEIAIECTDFNPAKRPDTRSILERLDEMASRCISAVSEAPSPLQRITSTLPMGRTEPNILAANAAGNNGGGGTRGLFRRLLSRVMKTRQRSGPSSFKDRTGAGKFSFAQLEAATKGFALEAKIGEGGFGTLYRGMLPDGREVAIKRGNSGPRSPRFQDNESAFRSELTVLSRVHHKHLLALLDYCEENEERIFVYEYMKNGGLYDHLHPKATAGPSPSSPVVSSWKLRIKILLDASRGIEYLHSYAVPPIIHRGIKSSNILLDAGWTARVSDFGLSLIVAEANPLGLEIVGTMGYLDPEYYCGSLQQPTTKSDVYGFGVVMLEVLTGKRAIFREADSGEPSSVVDYAAPRIVADEFSKVLDARAPEPAAHEAEAVKLVAYTAVHCVRLEGKDRPEMSDVVANLETAFALCESDRGGGFVNSSSSASVSVTSMDQSGALLV